MFVNYKSRQSLISKDYPSDSMFLNYDNFHTLLSTNEHQSDSAVAHFGSTPLTPSDPSFPSLSSVAKMIVNYESIPSLTSTDIYSSLMSVFQNEESQYSITSSTGEHHKNVTPDAQQSHETVLEKNNYLKPTDLSHYIGEDLVSIVDQPSNNTLFEDDNEGKYRFI